MRSEHGLDIRAATVLLSASFQIPVLRSVRGKGPALGTGCVPEVAEGGLEKGGWSRREAGRGGSPWDVEGSAVRFRHRGRAPRPRRTPLGSPAPSINMNCDENLSRLRSTRRTTGPHGRRRHGRARRSHGRRDVRRPRRLPDRLRRSARPTRRRAGRELLTHSVAARRIRGVPSGDGALFSMRPSSNLFDVTGSLGGPCPKKDDSPWPGSRSAVCSSRATDAGAHGTGPRI